MKRGLGPGVLLTEGGVKGWDRITNRNITIAVPRLNPSSPLWEEAEKMIQGYVNYLQERGRKDVTLRRIKSQVQVCEYYLKNGGKSTDPRQQSEDSFHYLRASIPLKESSVKQYLRTYSNYIEWVTGGGDLCKRAKLLWNPEVTEVNRITREQFEHLYFFSFFSTPTVKMLLGLGGMMGLRRNEMAQLKIGDIGPDYMIVHGKGHGVNGNTQKVHIPRGLRENLEAYLRWRKEYLNFYNTDTDWFIIFESYGGRMTKSSHRAECVSTVFDTLSKREGFKVTPHSLRRFYATMLYESGVDVQTIAVLMRHVNTETTWRYIARDKNKAFEASDALSKVLNGRKEIV